MNFFKFLALFTRKEPVWRTANGRKIPVSKMTTLHIERTLKCYEGKGLSVVPEGYLGGKKKWVKIFSAELSKRSRHANKHR